MSLVTAALFLRSIERAYEIDPGFQTKNLALFLTNPGQAGYQKPQVTAFYKEVRNRVTALPGIESASWASNLPLWGRVQSGLQVEGFEQKSKSDTIATVVNTINLQYFETAGTSIENGRGFTERDQDDSTPVAIVNEKVARDYWPNGNALGKRIRLPDETFMRQITGIAKNANYLTLGEPPQRCIYVPLKQRFSDAMTLYVRSKGDPRRILVPVQREMQAIAPRISVKDARTGNKLVGQALFTAKLGVSLLGVFGLLALALASIGLYGVMAYSVSQSRREIGVRMALGAARKSVLQLILKRGMSLVFTGVPIGFCVALLVGHLLERMLFGVAATDPVSMSVSAIVLSGVTLLACYIPAHRASRVDPLVALREA